MSYLSPSAQSHTWPSLEISCLSGAGPSLWLGPGRAQQAFASQLSLDVCVYQMWGLQPWDRTLVKVWLLTC